MRPRSTKAGVETPATLYMFTSFYDHLVSLNEGRSRNPGNTFRGTTVSPACNTAQRRPESKPRQHLHLRPRGEGRVVCAQRRPESKPRQHSRRGPDRDHGRWRSTKAGVETPATRVAVRRANESISRSTKAGVETPATQVILGVSAHGRTRSTKAGVETPATPLISHLLSA